MAPPSTLMRLGKEKKGSGIGKPEWLHFLSAAG
jgi:hypothetical protein